MKQKNKQTVFATTATTTLLLASLALAASGCNSGAATASTSKAEESKSTHAKTSSNKRRRLARLFWQDRTQGLIQAADLRTSSSRFEIESLGISGLEELNCDRQDYVQMVLDDGILIVGVRDHDNGNDASGWLAIDSGVEEESHGDHSHWHYDQLPKQLSRTIDAEQGNPAHVYGYGDHVYIANDKKNGFSQIRSEKGTTSAEFFKGGGGHITLAVVADNIAYSTWIDRDGENSGRVDVIDLRKNEANPKYSFNLPSGGIHGATACGNRVFFAPSNGVCWVDCDFDFAKTSDNVDVQHLSLSENETDIYRTGAFESFENHVLCIANCKDCPPAICLIDGTSPSPSVSRYVCDKLEDGLRLSTLNAVSVSGSPYALAFAEGTDVEEKLLVFQLDANGDRKLGDIELVKSIDVGKSKIEGHFGHHGIAFLDDHKTAVITNPGDGTVSVLNLDDWKVAETIDVGGQPTHIVAYGGRP